MKILIFNWMDIRNPAAGGAEVVTHEISKWLVIKGHSITIFCAYFQDCKRKEVVDGVEIYRDGNKYTVYYKARQYYRKYFKGKYDVIIDEINTVPFFTQKFVTQGERVYVLIHQLCREFWFHETKFPINLLGYYIFENKWLKQYTNIPTITVSKSSKHDLEEIGFENISIIPEGIDFTPLEKLAEKESVPTLIFTGRLKSSKNPSDALYAYDLVKKEFPHAKLWIVGDGYLKNRLKRDAREGVTFWGYISSDKKRELMKRAHVLLVPGIREGWGLVVTEANALGTPAVAYDVHGLRDSVQHNKTGLLCSKNTPQELALNAIRLLRDNQLYTKLSSAALEWSRTFSWENAATAFLEALNTPKKTIVRKERVVVLAEVTMPPLSRANLRVVKLAEALVKAGYAVTMVTPSVTPFSRRSYYQSGFHLNQFWGFCVYTYSRFRSVVRLWHLIGTVLSIIYLRVRFFEISVIHAWNPLAGLAASVAGKIVRTPVYVDFTDFYSDIARTDSPTLLTSHILRMIEKFVLSSASKVFVVSRRMKEELVKKNINAEKIFIIPDGVNAKKFSTSVSGENIRNKYGLGNNPLVIYHGDIKEQDGVDLLYKCFVKIRERVPGVRLMILGGGEAYFNSIVSMGKDLGIHHDIIYPGWVPHEEVPAYLASANVGAMPMRPTLNHNCYLSFKLFEYWGVGIPVIVSRLDAISEIVVSGYNGLSYEYDNIDRMADAYCELLINREKARELGRNGRSLVDSFYCWDKLMPLEVQAYSMKSSLEQESVAI
jgi:glycosyltransferase involved in cell wall biosynthesis